MTKTLNTTTKTYARLVRSLSRAYDRAIRAEEDAPTTEIAWKRASTSERCLRQLQTVQAGLALPAPRVPRTSLNLAKGAFAALAMVGKAVARAVASQVALRKAQTVNAARRAAKVVRRSLRSALRAVVGFVMVRVDRVSSMLPTVAAVSYGEDMTKTTTTETTSAPMTSAAALEWLQVSPSALTVLQSVEDHLDCQFGEVFAAYIAEALDVTDTLPSDPEALDADFALYVAAVYGES